MNILIAGASGNLGSQTTRHLLSSTHHLTLLQHKSPLPQELVGHPRITTRHADLSRPETLEGICTGVDCIIHFAGVLFAPRPQKFLPATNIGYVVNLAKVAMAAKVKRFILVSFPHAEGESTPDRPATGSMDTTPEVIHFRTRLEAERQLSRAAVSSTMEAVIFRAGIVYGRDIKLIRAARWLLRHRLMATWSEPTWAHLIALPDFLAALDVVIEKESAGGIYQVCDDHPLLLQDFLDRLADHWNYPRPRRLPRWTFHMAAALCETSSMLFRTPAFLNRDIIRAGMTSCVADTSRMKRELLPALSYPSITEGLSLL